MFQENGDVLKPFLPHSWLRFSHAEVLGEVKLSILDATCWQKEDVALVSKDPQAWSACKANFRVLE